MDKAAYEINLERCVDKTYERSVLDCRDNEEYWPQKLVRRLCGLSLK